jgi:hypothetical protein
VCRHIWELFLTTGLAIELAGYTFDWWPTFSRKADAWTPHERCQWAPLSWPLVGAVFALHLIWLPDLPPKEIPCSVKPSGCPPPNAP